MSNNNILIGAEGMDGANFLASCLTMSDEIYFNNCSFEEKVKFFFKGMAHIPKRNELPIWSDVSMLFNNCHRRYTRLILQNYQSKVLYESVKSTVKDKILINKVQMPQPWPLKILMSKNSQDPLVKLFESKYFIGMINPDLFISLRTVSDKQNFLGDSIYNLGLMTVEEFNLLTKEEQEKLKYKYQSNIERLFTFRDDIPTLHAWNMFNMRCDVDYGKHEDKKIEYKEITEKLQSESKELIKNRITHEWDCNWFLNEDETIENIKLLYSDINLGEFNEKLIRKMYKIWIYRIDHIKKIYINEFGLKTK